MLEKEDKEEYFKGKNFIVLKMMKNGSMKKADKMLKEIII